jgi:hypothetical protein
VQYNIHLGTMFTHVHGIILDYLLITLRNDILLKIKYLLFFRGFHLNTSCAKVYPCHELQSSIDESIDSMVATDTMIRDLTTIKPG